MDDQERGGPSNEGEMDIAPEEIKIIVFNRGTWNGLNTLIP